MRCLECGEESNYHRAVVELVTGTLLGSYCVDCERRRFGDRLDDHDGEQCACCDCPGHYLLSTHYLDLTGRGTSVESGWTVDDAPRLCFDHLLDLASPAELVRRRRRGVAWRVTDPPDP